MDCDADEVIVECFELLPPFVVLEPVCFAVPEEPVAVPVLELAVEASPVFVADGLCVWVAVVVLLLLELSFCRTTRDSNSGNHRGQGHAAVNVERKSRTSE